MDLSVFIICTLFFCCGPRILLLEARFAEAGDFKSGAAHESKFLLPSSDESRAQSAFARATPTNMLFVQRSV